MCDDLLIGFCLNEIRLVVWFQFGFVNLGRFGVNVVFRNYIVIHYAMLLLSFYYNEKEV